MSLIAICHTCKHRQRDCAGPCNCTLSGKDIIEHANEQHCPAGKFKLGLGDTVARVTHALHIPQCGKCTERQKGLNERFPSK